MEQTLVRGSHSDSSSDSQRQVTEQTLVRGSHSDSSSDSQRQVTEQLNSLVANLAGDQTTVHERATNPLQVRQQSGTHARDLLQCEQLNRQVMLPL